MDCFFGVSSTSKKCSQLNGNGKKVNVFFNSLLVIQSILNTFLVILHGSKAASMSYKFLCNTEVQF